MTTTKWGALFLAPDVSRAGDRLRGVLPPSQLGVEQMSRPLLQHWLFGCDATPGIVSIHADARCSASVWRRVGQRTERTDYRFANWFLTTSLELLAHLPAE